MALLKFTYSILKKFAALFGLNLFISKVSKKKNYETATPHATYAPWLSDEDFQKTYNIVKNYTLVDKYRCYELWQLVAESKKIEGALIEIGVWRGGTGALIAKNAELNDINNTVYLCDTFAGVVKAGEKDSEYKGLEHADTSQEIVEKLVFKNLGLKNVKILKGIFPEDTARSINEEEFRFCHIDVDVYQSAKDIFNWIWPKMTTAGIIVFDDYGFEGCSGITKLVNEEREKKDRLVVHNLNGHAIIIKAK